MKPIIKVGDKYNRLTAIKFIEMRKEQGQYWLFRCECGIEKVLWVQGVKRGGIKSCGCLNDESFLKRITKHNKSRTNIYRIWCSLRGRCFNKNSKNYKNYGGRGIVVCEEWLGENGFENFYKDMGNRPEGKSIDRIDNNGNYCPENCRWADIFQQANNKRTNHLLTYNNKTQNVSQWADELGIKYNTLMARLRYGWSIEKALLKK